MYYIIFTLKHNELLSITSYSVRYTDSHIASISPPETETETKLGFSTFDLCLLINKVSPKAHYAGVTLASVPGASISWVSE